MKIEDLLITEGFKDTKSKIMKYLKRGVLTATILLSLLGSLNAQDQSEVLDTVKQENPELYQELVNKGTSKRLTVGDKNYSIYISYNDEAIILYLSSIKII